MTQVENDGRMMQAAFRRLPSLRRARDLAEQVLNAELVKLEMETTRSFVIVEARRRLTGAEVAVVRALIDYNRARNQLLYDQGEILEKNNISVEAR
jgi:outer membrane protein TolC